MATDFHTNRQTFTNRPVSENRIQTTHKWLYYRQFIVDTPYMGLYKNDEHKPERVHLQCWYELT